MMKVEILRHRVDSEFCLDTTDIEMSKDVIVNSTSRIKTNLFLCLQSYINRYRTWSYNFLNFYHLLILVFYYTDSKLFQRHRQLTWSSAIKFPRERHTCILIKVGNFRFIRFIKFVTSEVKLIILFYLHIFITT